MKKIVSLAVLTALVAACTNPSGQNTGSDYGSDGFGEEVLVTGEDQTLNNTYLLAAAPKYYIGSAYKVEDVQYIPVEDLTYNQTGIAGIIPSELNGSKTSNGETFDINQMVATSKTLPLPTIARVTNLDNGSSVIVRVNNRGPFVNTRIMDLSPAAARKIGMTGQSKVQVQVLPEQTIAVKNATLDATTTYSVTETVTTTTPVTVEPRLQTRHRAANTVFSWRRSMPKTVRTHWHPECAHMATPPWSRKGICTKYVLSVWTRPRPAV